MSQHNKYSVVFFFAFFGAAYHLRQHGTILEILIKAKIIDIL